ncbi:hypothetical protein HFC70_25815 [Agrobacterium sp. a22-2]|uniref:MaoC/PaaZ C-terminal domain-containing protein n=1 Tax=Agrobacterium sp. a22-2 TaxID=2283840 RepID=UPI001446222C|nr:MaoC/PaaZ C-terminal domain-containing protein [Agrobacterium sp. a22-2]NKN39772.1 hypothetical protein [Agrobacterium sp. a22-2]
MTDLYTSTFNQFSELQRVEVGISNWTTIDQSRIDVFAETTEDRQYIHVDPDRTQETTFSCTIAHRFPCMSLFLFHA